MATLRNMLARFCAPSRYDATPHGWPAAVA